MSKEKFILQLKWAEMITPSVRHLAFERVDGVRLDFIPGQFITIHFEAEGKPVRRSYSIATIPGASDLIEFSAGHFPGGLATELLFNLEVGQQLEATGPFGKLVLREEKPARYIFVATSTGITPFRSMMPELARRMEKEGLSVIQLLGVQKRVDLLYQDEFLKFAKQHPQYQFQAHFSRESAENLESHEHIGYVQTAFEHLNLDPTKDVVYLCGNPNMIDEAFNKLKELGFDSQNIRREKYISSN
ncbi:MAG: ferredoxin--NADP reductase [Proteobacteria bacterium]|nr:ferredoxin--NADP reductase [Pseudomonadota bacterium]